MFLTLDDYKSVCDAYEFKVITENEQVRAVAEAAALEQVASYLRSRYDIAKLYALTVDDRNPMVVQAAVNIALFLMVHRLPRTWATNAASVCITTQLNGCATCRPRRLPPICPCTPTTTAEPTHTTPSGPVVCLRMFTTIKHRLNAF